MSPIAGLSCASEFIATLNYHIRMTITDN